MSSTASLPADPKSPYVTQCRNCVFAIYEGETQIENGCTLGRLAQFEARGATITGYDDGHKQFLTIDRFCNACHNRQSPYLKGTTLAEWETAVRETIRMRLAVVIYCDASTTEDQLDRTLAGWAIGTIRPRKILIVLDDTGFDSDAAIAALRTAQIGTAWEVITPLPWDEQEQVPYASHRDRCLDIAVQKLDAGTILYYHAMNAGQEPVPGYIDRLDRAINEELRPIVTVPDTPFGYTTMVAYHKHNDVVGNKGESIVTKFAVVNQAYHLQATPYAEIVPCRESQ